MIFALCISRIYLKLIVVRYNLRVKEFMLPRFNTTSYGKNSMKYLGQQLWSKQNSNIRNAPSIDAFIKAIKRKDLDVQQLSRNTVYYARLSFCNVSVLFYQSMVLIEVY